MSTDMMPQKRIIQSTPMLPENFGAKKGQPMTNPDCEEGTTEMSKSSSDTTGNQLPVEQWLEIRKEAGPRIDPQTAEVMWHFAYVFDPYGVYPEPPEEYQQVGREYFARSPGSDIWVWFGDLPRETQNILWEKHSSKLVAFIVVPKQCSEQEF